MPIRWISRQLIPPKTLAYRLSPQKQVRLTGRHVYVPIGATCSQKRVRYFARGCRRNGYAVGIHAVEEPYTCLCSRHGPLYGARRNRYTLRIPDGDGQGSKWAPAFAYTSNESKAWRHFARTGVGITRRNGYAVAQSQLLWVTQNWVRFHAASHSRGGFAELGTPQKRVRQGAFHAGYPTHAEVGTLWRPSHAELGTLPMLKRPWMGPERTHFCVDKPWKGDRASSFTAGLHADAPAGAESGTLWRSRAVEKPVGSVGYPRRFRFAGFAELGSLCRRIGFAVSQKRVRRHAESGSRTV